MDLIKRKENTELIISKEAKLVVSKQIKDCMQVLNTYGKKNFDYISVVKIFLERLAGYDAEEIKKAFDKYIHSKPDFPTPADIIGIIEGRIKPDIEVYKRLLKKRKDGFLTDDEEDYIYKYEEQVLNEW